MSNNNSVASFRSLSIAAEKATNNVESSVGFGHSQLNNIEAQLKDKNLKSFTSSLPASSFINKSNRELKDIDCRSQFKKQISAKKEHVVCRLRRTFSEPIICSNGHVTSPPVISPTLARYVSYLASPSTRSSSSSNFSSISITDSEDISSETIRPPLSASQLSLPEPPDGGWGWVVVVAAFFVHMITDGVIVSFGVLIDSLVEEFQDSIGATSWVGSFSYGVPALAAPLSSLLINRFGCRITCMLGGLLSGLGCFIGFFTNSLISLVFSFGILSGLGASFCITSALVIVSIYFDDRRATATGLSIAGTGMGALVFAPMVEALLNLYTWRGTFVILSGCFLNMVVCGALMRPVETLLERRHRQRLAWLEHLARESGVLAPKESSAYIDSDVLGRIKMLRDRLLAPRNVTVSHLHKNRYSNYHGGILGSLPCSETKKALASFTNKAVTPLNNQIDTFIREGYPSLLTQPNLIPIPEEESLQDNDAQKIIKVTDHPAVGCFINTVKQDSVACSHLLNSSQYGCRFCDRSHDILSSTFNDVMAISISDCGHGAKNKVIPPQLDSESSRILPSARRLEMIAPLNISPMDEVTNGPCERVDIFYRGSLVRAFNLHRATHESVLSLPELHQLRRVFRSGVSSEHSSSSESSIFDFNCCISIKKRGNDVLLNTEDTKKKKCLACCWDCCYETYSNRRDIFHRLFNFRLFGRPTFIFFILSNFLLYFWYNVTYFFMGVRATNCGMSEALAALLFSVLGGANTIGEVAVGFLADQEWVDALILYLCMLLTCGISTCLMPLLKTFLSMALYSTAFGMGLAANDALCTVLLVEFVGLPNLTSGLGICFFCQGVANIIGPPIIGYVIDATESADPAFVISGFGMILSGLVVLPIIIQRFRRRRARLKRNLAKKTETALSNQLAISLNPPNGDANKV